MLPGRSIGLPSHVGKEVQTVLRMKSYFVDGNVGARLALRVKSALSVQIPIRWGIQFRGVLLQRMGAELLDVDGHRRRESLGTKGIEPKRGSVRVAPGRHSIL